MGPLGGPLRGACRKQCHFPDGEQGAGIAGLGTGNRLESQWVEMTADVQEVDGGGKEVGAALILEGLDQRSEA